ncbi:MAG: hypothetical protein ACKV2O_13305 [Acidimicrobiales bacterium]
MGEVWREPWRRFRRRSQPPGPDRVRGEPPSGNGASSLHLFWDLPGRFKAVEVTLEVLEMPTVSRLYFWALQANFVGPDGPGGGAHLGLQFHPDYPGATAVNWGGYRNGGGELQGSASPLAGALGNVNTRDYPWQPGRPYRLRIDRSPDQPGWWQGSVRDLADPGGGWVTVRALRGGGTHLTSLMTWSEVFARCEHPPVTVRWSDPAGFLDDGTPQRPATMSVNYQARADGGCANTTAEADQVGIRQRTGTERLVAQGTNLTVPYPPP